MEMITWSFPMVRCRIPILTHPFSNEANLFIEINLCFHTLLSWSWRFGRRVLHVWSWVTTVCSYVGLPYMYDRKWLSSVVTWLFFYMYDLKWLLSAATWVCFFRTMPLSDVGVRFGAVASENKLEIYPDFPTSRRTEWQQGGTLAKSYRIPRQAPNWHFLLVFYW